MWVLGTLAKRWTAGSSLRGSIPRSSARPSNKLKGGLLGTFVVLTRGPARRTLKLLGRRAQQFRHRVKKAPLLGGAFTLLRVACLSPW